MAESKNELVFGFKVDLTEFQKKLVKAQASLTEFANSFDRIGRTFTNGKSIDEFFTGFLGKSRELQNLSQTLGISTEALQKWQYAATSSGVSSEKVISDLETLRTQFRMNEQGVLRLADSFKKMSTGSAYFYGKMYGISSDTVLMLRQGADAIKEMQNHAPILTEQDIKRSAELNTKFEQIKARTQKTAEIVVSQWVPQISKLVGKFEDWASSSENVEKSTTAISGVLKIMAGGFVLDKIGGIVSTFRSLSMFLNPVTLGITAVGAGITALAKDFADFEAGKESWFDWSEFKKGLNEVGSLLSDVGNKIKNIGEEFFQTDVGKGLMEDVKDVGKGIWGTIKGAGTGALMWIDWAANDRTLKGASQRFDALFDEIQGRDPTPQIPQGPMKGQGMTIVNNIYTSEDTKSVLEGTTEFSLENGSTSATAIGG